MTRRKGYFEDRPGVKSMSRLVAFIAALCIGLIVGAVVFAIVHAFVHPAEGLAASLPAIIGASAGMVGTLGAGAWGALRDRQRMDDTAGEAPPPQP